jgi:hypothetical protein
MKRWGLFLLLTNVWVWAWLHHWLGPFFPAPAQGREPQRLMQQIHPERISVVRALGQEDRNAVSNGALLCLETGYLTPQEGLRQAAALEHLQVPKANMRWVDPDGPSRWVVYMGKYSSESDLVRKKEEIKRRQLTFWEAKPEHFPGLVLATFDSESKAEAELMRLKEKDLHTAKVMAYGAGYKSQKLRLEKADASLSHRLLMTPETAPQVANGSKKSVWHICGSVENEKPPADSALLNPPANPLTGPKAKKRAPSEAPSAAVPITETP